VATVAAFDPLAACGLVYADLGTEEGGIARAC
jgi:hypothetical protein